MTILLLFWEFLKIGLFAFGGAYGAIPLIREAVLAQGWLDESSLMNLLGISESTPGPIMVNAATMIGYQEAGIVGAAIATLGVILPSFLIMLIVPSLQRKWRGHRVIRLALRAVKPCLAGVICATGLHLLIQVFTSETGLHSPDSGNILLFLILTACLVLFKKLHKRPISPILLIILSAALGILLF